MAGYKLLKRKGVDQVSDDFSDFSLSSPATKIRRLDAELPPIAEVELEQDEPLPVPIPVEAAEEAASPNEERALVLFKPLIQSSSPFSLTFNSDLISEIKNQVPWSEQRDSDCDRLLRSSAEREDEENRNRGLALVPWVPSGSTYSQFPTLDDSNSANAQELMEADELEGPEAEASMMMDVEQEDPTTSNNPSTLTLNHGCIGDGMAPEGFYQQQQHCLLPQLPQNTSTPITWTR